MKLPKQIPEQLQEKLVFANSENVSQTGEPLLMYEIYQIIIDYFEKEHDFWISVDTPPKKYSKVWIKNAAFISEAFFTDSKFIINGDSVLKFHQMLFHDIPPTHWMYFERPELLTETEALKIHNLYLKELAND